MAAGIVDWSTRHGLGGRGGSALWPELFDTSLLIRCTYGVD